MLLRRPSQSLRSSRLDNRSGQRNVLRRASNRGCPARSARTLRTATQLCNYLSQRETDAQSPVIWVAAGTRLENDRASLQALAARFLALTKVGACRLTR